MKKTQKQKQDFDKHITDELWVIVDELVKNSGGRLRMAQKEGNESEKINVDASKFLKLDGKRLGRDTKLYIFFGREVMGWEDALLYFLEEIILPLETVLPASYKIAAEKLEKLGKFVYSGKRLEAWRDCFKNTGE